MSFIAIIPARYASTRLPAKPLAYINGKPMVVHVMERAYESGANRVIVAVDHPEVAKVVNSAGGESCMTRLDHRSGTERLSEVIDHYGFTDDQVIVNIQGDEPTLPPLIVRQVVENLAKNNVNIATLAIPIKSIEKAFNPNVVKVVLDSQGYALYFSRATIPWDSKRSSVSQDTIGNTLLQHIGIYAYLTGFIRRYVTWKPSYIEKIESLEQLRILWYGEKIHVALAKSIPGSSGVDTLEDLQRVSNYLL